jgi:hypothetical protein
MPKPTPYSANGYNSPYTLPPTAGVTDNFLLTEAGDELLTEAGDNLIQE